MKVDALKDRELTYAVVVSVVEFEGASVAVVAEAAAADAVTVTGAGEDPESHRIPRLQAKVPNVPRVPAADPILLRTPLPELLELPVLGFVAGGFVAGLDFEPLIGAAEVLEATRRRRSAAEPCMMSMEDWRRTWRKVLKID